MFLGIRTAWWVWSAVVLLVAAIGLGFGAPVYRQRMALRFIEREGGEVRRAPRASGVVGDLLGDDTPEFLRPVTQVVLPESLRNDDGLSALFVQPGIDMLDLSYSPVTDQGLQHLRELKSLKTLWLDKTAVTDAGLANLKMLQNLELLSVRWTAVSDAGLLCLKSLPRLQSLYLVDTQVTGSGLAHLASLSQLRSLDLRRVPAGDVQLAPLASLTGLVSLDLQSTRLSDAGLAQLAALDRLEWLNLAGTEITDEGLGHLSAFPKLRELSLNNTGVSDAGLIRLRTLRSLRKLYLHFTAGGDGRVTQSGKCSLRDALPELTISDGETLANSRDLVDYLAFSPDGTKLASAGNAKIVFWSSATGEPLATMRPPRQDTVALAFSSTLPILASCGGDDLGINLWETERGWWLGNLKGHRTALHCLAFSPDGKLLVSGAAADSAVPGECTLRLWDMESRAERTPALPATMGVLATAFAPNNETIATGDSDSIVRLWNVASGAVSQLRGGHAGPVNSVAFSPDGLLLASCGDETIRIWDLKTEESCRLEGHTDV
ncbi:MAG TPA: hypothetical protein VKU82_07155, partial [Planctomycetaceae bacterium]|nr:hypothetical protein [Planctomycetaceae bacterium]